MRKLILLLFIGFAVFISNCKHDPNAIPAPKTDTTIVTPPPVDTNVVSNSKDSVCFSEEILPLLNGNCATSGCHDATSKKAGIILTDYDMIISTVSGSLLLQTIQDPGTNHPSPTPNQLLNTAQIESIKKWVNEGMKNNIDCIGTCDSVNVTFSGIINPIIQESCISCHNTTSPVLTSYANVKAQADNGKLNCAVNHLNGCSPMPQGAAQLSLCKLTQIKKWIQAGAPNN